MKAKTKYAIYEWVEALLIAAIIALVIRTFIASPYKIPSSSMRPTLVEGDRIFVNKFIYRFREPQRAEVIVFKFPLNPKRVFIKRLVAFGGEGVEILDGKLFIDNKSITHPETLSKRDYYNRGDFGREGEPVKVPEHSFYVLGDNSKNSRDSRYWGFVPEKNLIGKASFIWWPPSRLRLIR